MAADYGAAGAHPLIRKAITGPAGMQYNVNVIYAKGSTTLYMFDRVLGREKWNTALQNYQEVNKNKNVVHDDLFNALKAQWKYADYDAVKFLTSWAGQAGFPYVNITCEADKMCKYSQKRFSNDPNDKTIYALPYSYYPVNKPDKEETTIIFKDEQSGDLPHDINGFIKINPDYQGYYLVDRKSVV